MKITAQEEYGLRCLLQLAREDQDKGLTVKEIAAREGLSSAYVEKLLRLLAKGDLIHSVRGANGGYLLNLPPEKISLGAVVQALGSMRSKEDVCERFTGQQDTCVHIDDCSVRSAWTTLKEAIQDFLDRTYLSDLIGTEDVVQERLYQTLEQSSLSPKTY